MGVLLVYYYKNAFLLRNAKIIDSESELLLFRLKNGYLPRQTPIFKPKLNEKKSTNLTFLRSQTLILLSFSFVNLNFSSFEKVKCRTPSRGRKLSAFAVKNHPFRNHNNQSCPDNSPTSRKNKFKASKISIFS